MSDPIRARLDELEHTRAEHCGNEACDHTYDALRAVLDLAATYRENGKPHEAFFIERAIADALGVDG